MPGMIQMKLRPEYLKGSSSQPSDKRRYRRFSITLLGRFMRLSTKEESTCRLLDVSIGGASVMSDIAVELGEDVIVQFEEIGGLEGRVQRVVPGGFAVEFKISHRRRQRLAAQLTWLINRHELAAADQRRPGHDRIAITPKPVRIVLDDGTELLRNVIDVSISGASIDTAERPAIGSKIKLGNLSATVVRHHDRGIGVEFGFIQNLATIREDFG